MFRGCPPLPFLFGGCLPFPIPFLQVVREERALLIGGYPPSPISWLRAGGARRLIRVFPSFPWMRVGGARCRLRGTLCASSVWPHTQGGGGVLPVPFPYPCIHHVGVSCPCGILGVVPAPLGSRGGWVADQTFLCL